MRVPLTAIFVILASLSTFCQAPKPKKPYNLTYVTVTSTTVNQNQVRLIHAKNTLYEFMFQCNADDESCKAPLLGGQYQLIDDDIHHYTCDEYRMYRADGDWCIVCLDEVGQSHHY